MPKKRFPTDIIDQIESALEAWKHIDANLTIGTLSRADLQANLERCRQVKTQLDAIETQLIDLRNQREKIFNDSWDMLKRLKSAVKGIYGDDSSQYEMIGGTRMSERKKSTSTNKTTT